MQPQIHKALKVMIIYLNFIIIIFILKVMFYLMEFFRTSSLGDTISTNSERTALRRWGEESGYIDLCNKGQVV